MTHDQANSQEKNHEAFFQGTHVCEEGPGRLKSIFAKNSKRKQKTWPASHRVNIQADPVGKKFMPRALETFNVTWKRCQVLTSLYEVMEKVRVEKPELPLQKENSCDLLRASIIMGVAAMDGYFTDRFTDLLIPYIKKKGASKTLIELLSEAGLNTEMALDMLMMDRPYRRVRSLMENYFSNYTTQRTNVIDKLFAAYGLKNFTKDVCGLAKRKQLGRRVENFVLRRHSIAHEADMNAHGRVRTLQHSYVVGQLKDLKLFVDKADELSEKVLK